MKARSTILFLLGGCACGPARFAFEVCAAKPGPGVYDLKDAPIPIRVPGSQTQRG